MEVHSSGGEPANSCPQGSGAKRPGPSGPPSRSAYRRVSEKIADQKGACLNFSPKGSGARRPGPSGPPSRSAYRRVSEKMAETRALDLFA